MRAEEKLDRQAWILEAVLGLLARHGISGVSMRSVAREADVALGLVHYHFADLEYVVKEFGQGHWTTCSTCTPSSRPPTGIGRPGGQGVNRLRSRGKRVVWRMLSRCASCDVHRSRPMAKPPWGGMPWRKASR